MTIIKPGDPAAAEAKRKKTKLFICRMCGCEFEADGSEYEKEALYYTDRAYIDCPCCGETVFERKC